MEWDVDDYRDMRDYQEESRAERYQEARRNAQEDAFEEKALHCGKCHFSWAPGWAPRDKKMEAKLSALNGACPRCGSKYKEAR